MAGVNVQGYPDCRPGADFLNISREVRVSPIQLSSARVTGNSGGTTECNFRPEPMAQGFFMKRSVLYGKRTAEGV